MSINIKQVEISNIQAHKHFVFIPNSEGVTAIRGANGTGKSTIVDSIAWALYGTKPPGVSKAIDLYNEEASFPKDKCFVKVELTVDGRHFTVERKMLDKKGKTECNVVEHFVDEETKESEDRHQAGPAVSHAEIYIRKILRMDEKGFLTAILIQQKEVDKLISATARERAAVIEKLTGISSISNALTEARQEYNVINKTVNALDVDEKEVVEKKKEYSKLVADLAKETKKVEDLQLKSQKSKALYTKLSTQVEEEYQKIQDNDNNRKRENFLNAKIETYEENLEELVKEKDIQKKQLSLVVAGSNVEELETQIKTLRRDLNSKQVQYNELIRDIKKSEDKITQHKSLLEKSTVKTLQDASNSQYKAEAKVEQLKNKINDHHDSNISLNSEIKKLERAIRVLSSDKGTCPTCLQDVEDAKAAVEMLNKQKEEINEKIDSNDSEISSLSETCDKTENLVEKFTLLVEALEETETLNSEIKDNSDKRDKLKATIVASEAEIDALTKVYDEAKKQADKKESYDNLVTRIKKLAEAINTMKGELNSIQDSIKQSGAISESALESVRKKMASAHDSYNSDSIAYTESSGDLKVFKEKINNLEQNIENLEKEVKSYKALLNSREIAKATVQVIEEFKKDRINNSVPIIESYASDLITRFTEGKFTGIKMDDKFNTKVVLSNGKTRSVGSLSGGELSLSSIALLISISMLLNGSGSKNPIILDEVFVSQDSNRADLSISTIKEVCQGQVIMIAHNESLDSIADKVVELS